jgi:hypothetical protein
MFTNRNYLRTRIKKRQGKKFFPGHYVYTTLEGENGMPPLGSDADRGFRQLVSDNPNFTGYLNRYPWAAVEPSRGVYDFSKILEDLATTEADGKVMIVEIMERQWGETHPFPGPSYMNPESPDFDPAYTGVYFSPPTTPWKQKPNLCMPIFGDRMVELIAALGVAISKHPRLSMIFFTETANVGMQDQPGFTGAKYLTYLKRVTNVAAAAFPGTIIHHTTNWSEGMSLAEADEFIRHLVENHSGSFGATDIISLGAWEAELGLEPRSALVNSFGKYYDIFRGQTTITARAESPSFTNGTARTQYDHAVNELGANLIVWQINRGWNNAIFTIDDIIDVVNEEQGRTNQTVPSNLLT